MDIVILGSGVSGLATTYFLSKEGYKNITLITNPLSASVLSPWNIMVKENIDEIMLKAGKTNDRKKLKLFKENYSIIFEFFDELGIKYRESNIGIVPVGDRPGVIVINRILNAIKGKVKIVEDIVKGIKYEGNKLVSLVGEKKEYKGDIFILNIGGFGNLYEYSTYSLPNYSLHSALYKIGVKYDNLAFNMFHPFLIVDNKLPKTLISGLILTRLKFVNEKGKEFLSKEVRDALRNNEHHYIFHKMTVEFYKESQKSKIYAVIDKDIRDLIDTEFGWVIKIILSKGIKKFEIHPAFHYSLGGIVTNEYGKSNFENIYSIGESSTGLHGSNRVGGTAIAEGVIFSYILSKNLENYNLKYSLFSFIKVPEIKKDHKKFFWNNLGIVKRRETLEKIANYNGNDLIYNFAKAMAKDSLEKGSIGLNVIE